MTRSWPRFGFEGSFSKALSKVPEARLHLSVTRTPSLSGPSAPASASSHVIVIIVGVPSLGASTAPGFASAA